MASVRVRYVRLARTRWYLFTARMKWCSWWYELDGVRDSKDEVVFVTATVSCCSWWYELDGVRDSEGGVVFLTVWVRWCS